ncbi:MAG TPA: TfoX/Sxy family protein [Vineibacter sp.]|nr:TfoX/Sxy family protein [Vineibacter sp.]
MSPFIDYIRDQLRDLGPLTVRPMFGGHGLYLRGLFFGLVAGDTLYLRTDPRNRGDYHARGLTPFKPWADRAVTLKAYYPVPEEVLEDPESACAWARRALDAAQAAGRTSTAGGRSRVGLRRRGRASR